MFDLTDKVALVTGGGGVLGSALAKGLASAGARVALLGRTKERLVEKADAIIQSGGQALVLVADVLDQKQLEAARMNLENKWGRLDILVNCAGGNKAGATILPEQELFDLSISDFDTVTDLNLKGSLLPILVFGKLMTSQKSGSIINISSMAADRAITRVFGYSVAKAAVNNMTSWLSVELIKKYGSGIRVNAIAPGFFIADQNRKLLTNEDGSYTDRGKTIIQNTPMKRFGRPEELVSTVLWLSTDASSFITGIVVPVDGGFSAFSGV